MSYDQKSYDLAEGFLEDAPHLNTTRRRHELAQLIQSTIEDYIASEQSNYEPPDPPGFEAGFAENH
jgi:hypothetical protein